MHILLEVGTRCDRMLYKKNSEQRSWNLGRSGAVQGVRPIEHTHYPENAMGMGYSQQPRNTHFTNPEPTQTYPGEPHIQCKPIGEQHEENSDMNTNTHSNHNMYPDPEYNH